MTEILTGYLSVRRVTNNNFPYMNHTGRLYSELVGDFTPTVGTNGEKKQDIIVRGTFDKATYHRGMQHGFDVVIHAMNQQKSGKALYDADDRTRAYQSVNDLELQEALMSIDGVGDTYSERLVATFNQTGDFFRKLYYYSNGLDTTITCDVPGNLIRRVLDEEDVIREAVRTRSIEEAAFYNVLNQFGFVSFKKQNGFDFQRTIKEWRAMYGHVCSVLGKVRREQDDLGLDENLLDEYGAHFTWLMIHPELVMDIFGAPMASSESQEQKTVSLAHALLEVANSELDAAQIRRYGLEEQGMLAYSFDLYGAVKTYKDGGYDNKHDGDTVFPFTKSLHRATVHKLSSGYTHTYEDAIQALSMDNSRYPVIVFEIDGEQLVQFKATHTLNHEIVDSIRQRLASTRAPFVIPEEYNVQLEHVLADNRFGLHDDQKHALQGLNNHSVSVLTGGPGTGKTTILSVFLRTLSKVRPELFKEGAHDIVFCAPTGKAAKRMKDSLNEFVDEYPVLRQVQSQTYTIHSFLLNNNELLTRAASAPKGSKWLIIDESSMVDEDMLHWILNKVPDAYRLVFIGDQAQLPSIGAGSVLEDLLTFDGVGTFNLTKPYRSSGTVMENAYTIRKAAETNQPIRVKDLTFDHSFSLLGYDDMITLHKQELGNDDAYYDFVMHHAPTLYNDNTYSGWSASFLYKQMEMNLLDQKETLFLMPFSNGKGRAQRLAVTPYNQVIQGLMQPFRHTLPPHLADLTYEELLTELNSERGTSLFDLNGTIHREQGILNGIGANNSVVFRMGDKVISTVNQYQTLMFRPDSIGPYSSPMRTLEEVCGYWYARLQKDSLLIESSNAVMNGDMGEVKAVLKDGSIMVHFDEQPDDQWVFYKRDTNYTDHLALSYSTTIHKAQGGEADTVVLFLPSENDVQTMNYRELLYTAITRARSKVVIFGSPRVLEQALNTTKGNRRTALPLLYNMADETVYSVK